MGKGSGLRAYANKRDKAEADIVDALRQAGCSVVRMDKPCDLLVGHRRATYLVEVKTGKGKLTDSQSDFTKTWKGSPVFIIRDVDGVLETLKLWNAISPSSLPDNSGRKVAA